MTAPDSALAEFVHRERPAGRQRGTEHVEETRRDARHDRIVSTPSRDHRGAPRCVVGERRERLALLLPIQNIRHGHLCRTLGLAAAGHFVRECDNPFLFRVRQRVEEHGVHDAEHRRVGADGERHHHNAHASGAARPVEAAQGVPHVLQCGVQDREAASVPICLFDGLQAAEREERLPPGLVWLHACPDVLVHQHVHVAFELALELRVGLRGAAEHIEHPPQERAKMSHDVLRGAKNRSMIAVACCHSRLALTTRARPARVSL